ncbi:MAG TPA: hypothetical protein VJY12_05375 [Dysgonamonadaceae bacterium]|nr:hypothetical protein [Dysgonamonadaceae bacterium]
MKTKKQTLADFNKNVPFKVPENYFSQFNESIIEALPEKKITPVKPVTLWQKSQTWVYMAAMFLGLFFTMKVIVDSTDKYNPKVNTASTTISQQDYWNDVKISEDEFFEYIETQFIEEDYYDLIYNQDNSNSL